MQNVKANLIKINLKKGNFITACYIALQDNIGTNNHIYLPNAYAQVRDSITPKQWAGYLGDLAKEGKYEPIDECWGMVK